MMGANRIGIPPTVDPAEAHSGRSQEAPSHPDHLELGLWAPTLTEQGFAPFLPRIEQFEADDKAISRLHSRGLITYSQHMASRKKLAEKIKRALKAKPLPSPPVKGGGE